MPSALGGIDYYRTYTTSSVTTSNTIWSYWVSAATSSAATNTAVWSQWNGSYYQNVASSVLTGTEAIERAQREILEAQERRAQLRKELARAEERAATLLKQSLNKKQLEEFEKDRCFTVISKDGQRRYRINKGWAMNVDKVDPSGKRIHRLCAHPTVQVPEFDNMLMQKLMLENSEEEFIRIANVG